VLTPSRSGSGPRSTSALKGRQLALVQPGRTATLGSIAQALGPLGVEADHPVPERLAVHAGLARGALAAHPIRHVGEAEQPARHTAIALLSRQAAQL
jgi:hypothetical protein